jgi:Reverse transcriptase (RNA-dependent DNA polymerase)
MVNDFLINKGFERMEADPCIYKKKERVKVDGKDQIKHSIVALYVDDLVVACSTTRMCKDLEALFQSEFQMKIIGEVRYTLGMEVNNDLKNHEIHMSQIVQPHPVQLITVNARTQAHHREDLELACC